jgi:hypothetical protein
MSKIQPSEEAPLPMGNQTMNKHQEPAVVKQYGNSRVIIHSRLASMTRDEQKAYFDDLKQKGDARLKEIDQRIIECQME